MEPAISYLYDAALATVEQLQAKPLILPEGLELVEATFKGEQVHMKSKAWQNKDFRLIRYTGLLMGERLCTFNFVLYPYNKYDAPVFASDWVVSNQKLRIAVMDAMPLFPENESYHRQWVEPFMPLCRKSQQLAPVFERKLSWSTRFLGEAACLATGISTSELPELASLWKEYLSLYLSLFESEATPISSEKEEKVAEWHRHYNAAHLQVENERNPYMVYFGKEFGKRYNEEFLFSDSFGN